MREFPGLILSFLFVFSACSSVPPNDVTRIVCTWGDYTFDTRSGTLSLHIRKDSVMMTQLRLKSEDERTIVDAANEIGFFGLSHDAPFTKLKGIPGGVRGTSASVGGCTDYFIRIETTDNTNWVKWNTCDNNREVDRESSVWHLLDVIVRTIEQKPEYRELPRRFGI